MSLQIPLSLQLLIASTLQTLVQEPYSQAGEITDMGLDLHPGSLSGTEELPSVAKSMW